MRAELKSYQICMDPDMHEAIKRTAKYKRVSIGEFIAVMFNRHKDKYFLEILEPLESEIAGIKNLMDKI